MTDYQVFDEDFVLIADDAKLGTTQIRRIPVPNFALALGAFAGVLGAETLDVRDFGAVCNGTTNDTAAIQDAVDAAGPGRATVIIPANMTSLISAPIVISTPGVTFRGGGTLTMATGLFTAISIRADHVTVKDITITGPGSSTQPFAWTQNGIDAIGSLATPLEDVTIENVTISGVPGNGIYLDYVDGFKIADTSVTSILYAGIAVLHGHNGKIDGNRVTGNTNGLPGNANAYGIFLTRSSSAGDWHSEDISVTNNHVSDFPTWEGIDTHGGERLTIAGNIIERCSRGVAVIRATNTDGSRFAPHDVSVIGNTIDSGTDVLTGRVDGITVSGASSADGSSLVEAATGLRVVGNIIRRHGLDESNRINGGIIVFATTGAVITGNIMERCSSNGIAISSFNDGVAVTGNTIVDPCASVASSCAAIRVTAGTPSGVISGNTIVASGTLSGPTRIAQYGLHVASGVTALDIEAVGNNWAQATVAPVLDQSGLIKATPYALPLTYPTAATANHGSVAFVEGGNVGSLDRLMISGHKYDGTAAWLDLINDPNEYVQMSFSTAQAVADATWTAVSWATTLGNGFTVPSLPSTAPVVIPFGGMWHVDLSIVWRVPNGTGERGVRLYRDGVLIDWQMAPASSVLESVVRISRGFSFNTGVVLSCEVYQSSGGSLSMRELNSVFGVRRVSL